MDEIAVRPDNKSFIPSDDLPTPRSDASTSSLNNFRSDFGPASIEIVVSNKEELMGRFTGDVVGRFGFAWRQNEEKDEGDAGNESDSDTVVYSPLEGKENLETKETKHFSKFESQ